MSKVERNPDGTYPQYAWPGGYPMYYEDNQGSTVCADCASKDADTWPIVAAGYIEDAEDETYCNQCSANISAS